MSNDFLPRALVAAAVAAVVPHTLTAQAPTFEVPKAVPPDADTLKQIEAKRAELTKAIAALPAKTPDGVRVDVEVYAKAAEWIVRHGEWFTKDSAKQTLAVLDAGLGRAKAAAGGKAPWRDVRNKPVVRGYRSRVDGSVQPYSVTIPAGYDASKPGRLDIDLHGRDQTLSEVKFIAGKEAAKPAAKGRDFVLLEPYGRGNNAYRWAGEADVFEGLAGYASPDSDGRYDPRRLVLRGFSMGGAGTWHIGLHRPAEFAVIGPGAGFSVTRGYVKLPAGLPVYVEKCLHVYDAVDYAENAFNVPVVAYSGGKDPQKASADNVENALKGFNEPVRFTRLIAPDLEHKMPPEWQAKAEAEYVKYAGPGRNPSSDRERFVTYTTRYGQGGWTGILALDAHYTRAVLDAKRTPDGFEVRTENVRAFELRSPEKAPRSVTVDGQQLTLKPNEIVEKTNGKWGIVGRADRQTRLRSKPEKTTALQGPIDDAFASAFTVSGPVGEGWSASTKRHAIAAESRFAAEWDKFFRGKLPTGERADANLVLFGDPASNPLIAKVLPKLPITWTREKLVVNGVEYDPKTHLPVLIYPNPLNPGKYVVINSGHTFHAAELQGSNAQLYPRLGDWAVLKVTPTEKDPTAAEVVAGGLFDEFWQFTKK